MEIQFRPMQRSTLARRVTPGQASTEEDQSFPEVVESLAGAEQAPEQNPGGGGDRQQPLPQQWSEPIDSEPSEDTTEQVSEPAPEKPASKSSDKPAPEERPLGVRLDLTG